MPACSMKTTANKSKRKSRRLRLNISVVHGGDPEFNPTNGDWNAIEAAYGATLSCEDRVAIVGIAKKYFLFAPSENNAPFADDAFQYLDRLEKAANNFWQVLLETENIPMAGQGEQARIPGVAIGLVQNHVGRFLKQRDSRSHNMDWRGLLNVMQTCLPALVEARKYLQDNSVRTGFVEGRRWDQFVWDLTEFAKKRQLPTGVSKFDDPGQASPFVRFVRELQQIFPAEFRRHHTSNASLTEAITVARRQIKRAIASLAKLKEG